MLSVEELKVVREFLGRSYDLDKLDQRLDWQSEAQRLDERLTNWREEFVAAVFQLINYEKGHLPRGEMESFFTLTNCILNEAIIVLLQQMAPMPKGIETTFEHWAFATTRCTYACENLTATVRRIGADQLERESPYLISPLFVAARFYIVYSKALDADVPANLHTLAFILHACGKRWPLAQLYETIIRTAVAEHRSPISECVLPVEFYDFRYTTLEITELLQSAGTKLA
ncbi:C6 transcription factor [Colletotrichum asianum]|uniref:C6 transcription factor n=1 Tax=Colletotrichum asianum TaxID=702518 RepID=A0A8H3WDQ4_9PEZI|nr:C6 transcription factor [Colletotrichum asianum]